MPRLMLAFLFCLLAGIAIWFALRNAPVPTAATGDAQTTTPTESGSSRPTSAAEPAADLATGPAADAASQRTPAAVDAPTTPGALLEVLVVDAAHTPVPNAEIAIDEGAHTAQLHAMTLTERCTLLNDGESAARRFGRVVRTGDDGVALVPNSTTGLSLHARADARYGFLYLANDAAPAPHRHRLTVHHDRTLRVRVVDADGRPTPDVAVTPAQHGDGGVFLRKWQPKHTTFSTAPDGIATFPHMQTWDGVENGLTRPLRSWRVRLDIPGHDDPGVAFDPAAPPAEPIELRLPPATGTLAVRLVVGGRPVRVNAEYWLYSGKPGAPTARNDAWNARTEPDGYARFRFVALQQNYVAGVFHGGSIEQSCAGPIAADQEVKFDLTPTADSLVLTGTFVDAGGRPIPSSSQVFAHYDFGSRSGSTVLTPDDSGRFTWIAVKASGKPVELRKLVFSITSGDGAGARNALSPRTLAAGVHDLGVVPLVRGACVVAGTFTTGAKPQTRAVAFVVERLVPAVSTRDIATWQHVPGLSIEQPGDGRFEVTGDVPAGRYRMQFGSTEYLPLEPVEFDAGATGLVIPIDFGATLTATARIPDDCPPGLLGILRAAADPDAARAPRWPQGSPSDRFTAELWSVERGRANLRWNALPAGSYTLELRIHGFADPLHVIRDVVVPPTDGGDARLVEIDLRDRVGVATLRIDDAPAATRDDKLLVVPQPPIDAARPLAFEFEGNVARIPIPLPSASVQVARAGSRPKVVDAVPPGETVVAFDAWPAVDVAIDVPALPTGTQLRAALVNDAAQKRRYAQLLPGSIANLAITDAPELPVNVVDGNARLPIGTSPRALRIWLHGASGTRGQLLAHDTKTVSPGQTNVTVRITADELARGVQALR